MFVVDAEGMLVFYNEAAERIAGKPFAEMGEISAVEWGKLLRPTHLDGTQYDISTLPSAIAHVERRPAHDVVCVRGVDGVDRTVEVTAIPLMARADHFAGSLT